MAEFSLLVDKQVFKVNKDVLCEYSDYFRAMFNGNYAENDKREISIDVLDAESMRIMLEYMNSGLPNQKDLKDYSLAAIEKLASAACFLQMTKLIDRILYVLYSKELCPENCMEIMNIADNSGFNQLEQQCATYSLLSFKYMKPEFITDISVLCWFLSHPYLEASSELDVFHFGHMWVLQNEARDEALLIVLGCLDIEKLTHSDLAKILSRLSHNQNCLAAEVAEYLYEMAEIQLEKSMGLVQLAEIFKELYSDRACNETLNLIKESRSRLPTYTLVVLLSTHDEFNFYTYTENGFEKWITFPEEYIQSSLNDTTTYGRMPENLIRGWKVLAWGLTKMVVFVLNANNKRLKVYDVLKKEWTCHDTTFKSVFQEYYSSDLSLTYGQVIGDLLYLISSSGYTKIYDLKARTYITPSVLPGTYRKIAVCAHEGRLYAAANGGAVIYEHKVWAGTDDWRPVVDAGFRINVMASFKGYVYCTQSHTNLLYRFRPGVDEKLQVATRLSSPASILCNLGNRLLFFTTPITEENAMNVEEYYGNSPEEKPSVLLRQENTRFRADIVSCCPLVMTIPPLNPDISNYAKEHLKKYRPHFKKN